ncbi:hypothetical protein [Amycolatopsis rubida]|uniref:Capsid maturation protease n=1 Tax=Amycolatopsis rubida TaxID=112413 RepID=A0A1I5IHM8_9PSEU|nr:hypothetical protein [Amycolatopsis rubida]SFO59919.1 hypothetical protein SAMN05421854_102469 [Amycolatopsis rubida]
MSSALELARRHYRDRRSLADATVDAGLGMWRSVDPGDLSRSWGRYLARMLLVVRGAQTAAASTADRFADAVLDAQGSAPAAAGRVSATALAGIASDGRDLLGLLLNPVIAAKVAIRDGATIDRALATGQASLEMVLRTQVADAGRVADGVAVAARPRTSWTRMVVGDSCPRCILLAGRVYRFSAGFLRHPNCDCVHIPTADATGDDFTTDPRRAFEEGRVRGLSKADEQAVRDGADLAQVVNAHRGMYTAAGQKLTREGTTRSGFAGRRLGGQRRLMPEQIYRDATSRDEAVRMLRLHGYLI